MIKILFLTNDLGLGGVQRLVVDFANGLSKDDFEVWVGTLWVKPESFFYKDKLSPDINYVNFAFRRFFDLGGWWRLYHFIRQNKFDIVFTQLFMADTVGRITAWLARTPVIITEIQNLIPDLPKKYILVDRALAKITDICISPVAATTDYAIKTIGFPTKKIVKLATNAVEGKRFSISVDRKKVRQGLGVPENAPVVINVGRLVGQKGQGVLLEAAVKILKEKPDTHFLIAGSGRLEEELKQKARELNLGERVKFLGDRKDIPELLMSSDVFAFPSLWEGQGLILFEVFFSKLPIAASNVGGIPEVVRHETTGLLVKPGDADDLARGILRLLNDPALAAKLADDAYKKFKDRTMENVVKQLEDLFKKLVRR